jgi:NAD(P)-dependent dehydrogenase (short-subunit alcohol dehydrogenase family)
MGVLDSFSLRGKVAVLTGGAGLYGRQCLTALAEAGADTFIASRNLEALEKVAAEYRARGLSVTALTYDQGEESSILRLRDEVAQRKGKCDILVNNAVSRNMRDWADDASSFDADLRINGTGLFMVTRAFGELMIPQRSGSIINISSMMGMVGLENHNYDGTTMESWCGSYFFHKGGMINFTRFCASYFGRFNIRANCISPGGLEMPSQPARFKANYSERTQLGRLANDTDLMGLIVYLASDASLYMTGANIPLDGGYTAK